MRVEINFAELSYLHAKSKLVLLNSSAVSGESWALLEGKFCIPKNLLAQTKFKTLRNRSSLFRFVGGCCEGFMLLAEQLG